jgi:hypothetical protein
VVQLREILGLGQIEGVWPADGSESGNAAILRRMDEFEKEEIPAEEAEDFAAALEEAQRFTRQKPPRQTDPKP